MSPTSKSSRSDSRTSFGSIFDNALKDKSMERVSQEQTRQNLFQRFKLILYILDRVTFAKQRKLRVAWWQSHEAVFHRWWLHLHVWYYVLLQLWQVKLFDDAPVTKIFIQNYFRLIEPGDPSERINPQPCVPSVVTTCIRWDMKNIFKAKDNKIYLQISWASWAQYCWHFPSELQSEESETVERGLWQWSWCDLDGWSQCSRCRVHSQGILSWPSRASAAPRGVSATSSNSK